MQVFCKMVHGHNKIATEDRLLINNSILSGGDFKEEIPLQNSPLIFAIADGVGGNYAGALAAHLSVEMLIAEMLPNNIDEDCILKLIKETNKRIIERAHWDSKCHNMATTLSGICYHKNQWFLFHIGNCRVYTWKEPYLTQLTVDHTVAREMHLLGMSKKEINASGRASEINSCLGNGDERFADELYVRNITPEIEHAEMLVFSTDGIHDYIDNEELENSFQSIDDISSYFSDLFAYARANGSKDDLSIMIIQIDKR